MFFDKATSAGHHATQLSRLFQAALHRRIKPLGLSPGVFPALIELWEQDGLTQRELVDRLEIEQATMANTLARMERDGLVNRRPHPTDRRAQQVWLTETARACREAAIREAQAVNEVALAGFTHDERETAARLMLRMIDALAEEKRGTGGDPFVGGGEASAMPPAGSSGLKGGTGPSRHAAP